MLAITRLELQDIRRALTSALSQDLPGYKKENISEGLRVISAILRKDIEVFPKEQINGKT